MPSRHCKICGAFALTTGLCGRCSELSAERTIAAKLRAELTLANQRIASEKRYRVYVTEFFWETEKTWTEAVTFAKRAIISCKPYKVEIRDEKLRVIRAFRLDGDKIVES